MGFLGWDESKHPRDKDGEWTFKGGGEDRAQSDALKRRGEDRKTSDALNKRGEDKALSDALKNRAAVNDKLRKEGGDTPPKGGGAKPDAKSSDENDDEETDDEKKGDDKHDEHVKALDKLADRPAPSDHYIYSTASSAMADQIAAWKPGKVITDKGYQTGSRRQMAGSGKQIVIKVKVPKDTRGVHLGDSDEVMLHRGSRLRYDGMGSSGGRRVARFTTVSKRRRR